MPSAKDELRGVGLVWERTNRNTAVCGNASSILRATLMFASSMNSSTRLFVSRSSFCSTSIGSEDSELSSCILTSGEARFSAPASIRFAFNFCARELSSRMLFVRSSSSFLRLPRGTDFSIAAPRSVRNELTDHLCGSGPPRT